jgi:hypothetical protein
MRLVRRIFRSSPVLLMLCAGAARAQNERPAAAELGRKILAVAGSHPLIAVHFENRSSMGVTEAAALRREIAAALRVRGARLVAAAKGAQAVDVTVSESWRKLLLVAKVGSGQAARVVMVELGRSGASGESATGGSVVSLSRRILWRQRAPFLSFLLWQSPVDRSAYLSILEPDRLILYRQEQGQWRRRGAADIPHRGPWPRDVRGLLWIGPSPFPGTSRAPSGDRLRVSLPGVACSMPLAPAAGRLPLACRAAPSARDFPIFHGAAVGAFASLVPARNFFGPEIEWGGASRRLQPFYAATIVNDDRNDAVLAAAALDGKTYLYDGDDKAESSVNGWGSELAGVETGCGSGWQVLGTRPGDWTANDSLAAYEIVDGKAVATGEPVDLPGPVLALDPEPERGTAGAVVLDRNAGFYEAYTVTLSCSR